MRKAAYLFKLSEKLNGLSETDRNDYLEDYSELIDDRLEAGIEEETVIAELGDIEETAEAIRNEVFKGSRKEIPVKTDESVTYTEDHSVIDCTNRYISDDGKYIFSIKVPEGTNLIDVMAEITSDCEGTTELCTNLSYLDSSGEWDAHIIPDNDYNGGSNSYNGSEHYLLISSRLCENGMGIRLYLEHNDRSCMATDTAPKSTVKGRGYWLGEQ